MKSLSINGCFYQVTKLSMIAFQMYNVPIQTTPPNVPRFPPTHAWLYDPFFFHLLRHWGLQYCYWETIMLETWPLSATSSHPNWPRTMSRSLLQISCPFPSGLPRPWHASLRKPVFLSSASTVLGYYSPTMFLRISQMSVITLCLSFLWLIFHFS